MPGRISHDPVEPRPRPLHAEEPGAVLDAAAIAPALSAQDWTLNSRPGEERDCAFLLTGGTAVLHGTEIVPLSAPALLWVPARCTASLAFAAGARGHRFALDPAFRPRAFGSLTEAPHLLRATDGLLVLASDRLGDLGAEIETAFLALARESRAPGRGTPALLSAHLAVIALHLWRLSSEPFADAGARSGTLGLLQRFRHLVEERYRDHWPVADYARALGVTEDRLHALCVRGTGRPPRTLLHERLIEEAAARLQHLDWPIEQIGFSLGFKDAGYFNRFFKKHTGLPPGLYRRQRRARIKGPEHSYAAWP